MRWLRKWLRRSELFVQPIEEKPKPIDLTGQIAMTVTPLRTSGLVELNGRRYEVFSTRGFVPPLTAVRFIGQRMGWWTVEPLEPEA